MGERCVQRDRVRVGVRVRVRVRVRTTFGLVEVSTYVDGDAKYLTKLRIR